MSREYDLYLEQHKANVQKAFEWIRENLPDLVSGDNHYEWYTNFAHDQSKTDSDEYPAYDAYFYGGNRSYQVVQDFELAFLNHLHKNPHHWQHWILPSYDDEKKEKIFEMPHEYVIEMICDWWSFSWKQEKLDEIFSWYEDHKKTIQLHPNTRYAVEDILRQIHEKLKGESNE